MLVRHQLVVASVLGVALAGCGAALNQTAITCPAGRTLLDGVCVAEAVADYVACVRAQGAELSGSKRERIFADVGTVGIKAGGAAEVGETLARKYAASESAMLEIIRRCSASSPPAPGRSAEPAAPPPQSAAPPLVGAAKDVTGTWSTTVAWDRGAQSARTIVVFTQKGTHVSGTFHLPNEGHIEAELVGDRLQGTWSRPPYGGHIELTFEGATFRGTYGDAPGVFETWTGRRD